MKQIRFFILALPIVAIVCSCGSEKKEVPNILWITSEDNSPLLGCYGDEFAQTPNLDKLASEGFLFIHAYANAPVCAPARNTIASGVYASSGGHSNMRSNYDRSKTLKYHAEAMKELGYYCTNNRKTDYNTNVGDEIWDECSDDAHYKNAPEGNPWFAIFNTTISHESKIHDQLPIEELIYNPKDVPVLPYHPRTPDMEHDWAQYYQRIHEMDAFVGEKLKELEDAGLADNTIVIYYADHGGVFARSKRYVYESGTHVPFIVRIPEKFKYLWPKDKTNSKVDRLISFVDLFPTLLNIAGADIPDYLQGEAFLGEEISPDPEYAYMFRDRMDEWYDMSRAVRNRKYRYIHNYMPHRIYCLPIAYLFKAKSIQSWEEAYKNGECNEIQSAFWEKKPVEELYDIENDPFEINNLALNPDYKDVLMEMRKANRDWLVKIKDNGFMPEDEQLKQAGERTLYDFFQSGEVQIAKIIDAAETASFGDPANIDVLVSYLKSDEPAIRYWGAIGLLILEEKAMSELAELKVASEDESVSVATAAAEALYKLGAKEEAYKAFTRALQTDREFAQTQALNAIYLLDDSSDIMKAEVESLLRRIGDTSKGKYNYRAAMGVIDKWGGL
ncbi:sulfatase-like hydrolase/transferase [Marinilabilia salmonicolor]|uniref:Arylsulfatase A-like enzyme n=1 Tax=Marinilabilia salmonicolor TaxID=989 RepID=A0A368V7M8_9BACT|nr:sulfatase-like hydrolase/transferase [Marinilabilia salmonicolor]RCW36813.1 arylsulfatase A-like enzyme [Marinilabilia salmonicolor]